jgi:hypothetical protein
LFAVVPFFVDARSGAGFPVPEFDFAVCLAALDDSVDDSEPAPGDFAEAESPRLRIDPNILPRPGFLPESDSEAGSGSGSGRGAPGSPFPALDPEFDTSAVREPSFAEAL